MQILIIDQYDLVPPGYPVHIDENFELPEKGLTETQRRLMVQIVSMAEVLPIILIHFDRPLIAKAFKSFLTPMIWYRQSEYHIRQVEVTISGRKCSAYDPFS
jgi:hypothetical protein